MPTETSSPSFLPADDRRQTSLETDPFRALNYHFGMLLGDEDFRTDQGYHRGKVWLHSAWLHRAGVVWGFAVSIDDEEDEVRVEPGLALDAAGRELHLDRAACLHLPSWYRDHREDEGFEPEAVGDDGTVRFDARVVACFRACLAGEVPALAESCAGARSDTAFSRVLETVHLRLEPIGEEAEEEPPPVPYRRVRILFGLLEPDPEREGDSEAAAARTAVEGLDPAERPAAYARELQRLGLLDAADLEPADAPDGDPLARTPGGEDVCLVLGELRGIEIAPDGDGFTLVGEPDVERSMCPVHVATRIIQELACGPGGAAVSDAGGPRVLPESVERVDARTLRLRTNLPLLDSTVTPDAFSVTSLGGSGWTTHDVDSATPSASGDGTQVDVAVGSDIPTDATYRLIARGTGPTPILGTDEMPLAGAVGGPATGSHDGRDFVFTRRS